MTFLTGKSMSKPLTVPVSKNGITWVRFTINDVSGTAAGLSELEVF